MKDLSWKQKELFGYFSRPGERWVVWARAKGINVEWEING